MYYRVIVLDICFPQLLVCFGENVVCVGGLSFGATSGMPDRSQIHFSSLLICLSPRRNLFRVRRNIFDDQYVDDNLQVGHPARYNSTAWMVQHQLRS